MPLSSKRTDRRMLEKCAYGALAVGAIVSLLHRRHIGPPLLGLVTVGVSFIGLVGVLSYQLGRYIAPRKKIIYEEETENDPDLPEPRQEKKELAMNSMTISKKNRFYVSELKKHADRFEESRKRSVSRKLATECGEHSRRTDRNRRTDRPFSASKRANERIIFRRRSL